MFLHQKIPRFRFHLKHNGVDSTDLHKDEDVRRILIFVRKFLDCCNRLKLHKIWARNTKIY